MLSGSLVEVYVGLHSCLCFSLLEKLPFSAVSTPSSTPPRYLVICRDSQVVSYRNLDTSSTPDGSIEKFPVLSIDSRYLLDRSRFTCAVCVFFLDTCLDTLWIDRDFFCLLDTFSTPCRLIELLISDIGLVPRYL